MGVINYREKKKMKNNKKTKPDRKPWFLCFTPVNPPPSSKCVETKKCCKAACRCKSRRDLVVKTSSASKHESNDNVVFQGDKDELPGADISQGIKLKRKKKLLPMMNSLLFDTFRAKKIFSRSSSSRQNSFRSDSNSSTSSNGRSIQNPNSNSSLTSSSTNTSSSLNISRSSSSISSRSVLDRSPSIRTTAATHSSDDHQPAGGQSSINYGLCLLLACIMVLMLWGKVWAIFGTSGLLLLFPSLSVRHPSFLMNPASEFQEIGSASYKKRTVMEGLLDRENNSNTSI